MKKALFRNRTMKLPGLNVQAPWARLLLDGEKTVETRTYPLPEKYVDKDLWLIETPGPSKAFKARVIGVIRFTGSKRYQSAAEFYRDRGLHLIDPDSSKYAWKTGILKYRWQVGTVRKVKPFAAPFPRGIVYCRPFARLSGRTHANR